MIGRRDYSGSAIDATWQSITERPELEKEAEKVEYATEPDAGEERTENVPIPEEPNEVERPDVNGQTTLSDWGVVRRERRRNAPRALRREPPRRHRHRGPRTSRR